MMLIDLLGTTVLCTGVGYLSWVGARDVLRRVTFRARDEVRSIAQSAPKINPAVLAIVDSMNDHGEEWKFDDIILTHAPTKIEIWMYGGVDYVAYWDVSAPPGCTRVDAFCPTEKKLIWDAFIRMNKAKDMRRKSVLSRAVAKKFSEHASKTADANIES